MKGKNCVIICFPPPNRSDITNSYIERNICYIHFTHQVPTNCASSCGERRTLDIRVFLYCALACAASGFQPVRRTCHISCIYRASLHCVSACGG